MISLDIAVNTYYFLYSFIFYFLSLFLFFYSRLYFFVKSFLLLMCFSILLILYQYYYFFFNCIICETSISYNLLTVNQNIGLLNFTLSFSINKLTYLFSLLVLIIGFSTNIYVLNYFKNEADEMGFLFWLNSFILSMIILVLSNNFLTLFLGWELIGFTSFFLINFWQSRRATLKSSFKAFSFNLISDFLLLTFLIIVYTQYSISDIDGLSSIVVKSGLKELFWLKVATVCLIGCASIKSVQIIGHLWLPDSMEAPVPASSLIHSATLVSAGIFLLLRFHYFLVITDYLYILIYLGSITAAYGGVVAASQTDVKKLLAYSTMSHCGFLCVLVGLGDTYITIIYLFLHGLFKASTFFCVGSFIRVYGGQDTRIMGSGHRLLWGDSLLLILCAINLCGLPLTIGFMYKFFFFKLLFISYFNLCILGLLYIALLSSLIYFYRLIMYTVFDRWKLLWGSSPFLLQNLKKQSKIDKRISMYREYHDDSRITTFGHWVAVLFIIFFSIYVYFIIYYLNYSSIRSEDIIDVKIISSNIFLNFFIYFFNTYLIYFYTLYLLIFILLCLITWKKNYFFFDKLFFYVIILISSLSLNFMLYVGFYTNRSKYSY